MNTQFAIKFAVCLIARSSLRHVVEHVQVQGAEDLRMLFRCVLERFYYFFKDVLLQILSEQDKPPFFTNLDSIIDSLWSDRDEFLFCQHDPLKRHIRHNFNAFFGYMPKTIPICIMERLVRQCALKTDFDFLRLWQKESDCFLNFF